MRWGKAWIAMVLAACSSAAETVPDGPTAADGPAFRPDAAALGCDSDVAPGFDACVSGDFFADCGGFGPARLACKGRDCRWFATTCIAADFVASPCPPENICCQADWPLSSALYPASAEALF